MRFQDSTCFDSQTGQRMTEDGGDEQNKDKEKDLLRVGGGTRAGADVSTQSAAGPPSSKIRRPNKQTQTHSKRERRDELTSSTRTGRTPRQSHYDSHAYPLETHSVGHHAYLTS